ncbi:unnamed protein product, partial [marine sediment metagenome]
MKELINPKTELPELGRCRKSGAGRKPVWKEHPEILDVLTELVEAHTKGDPARLLPWTNKSLRNLSAAMKGKGYSANKGIISRMLKILGYGL